MQPMINIALRAIRSANEQLIQALDRDGGNTTNTQDLKRFLAQVEMAYHDSLARALTRAYPTHRIAKRGDFQSADKGYSWHISTLHNPLSFLRRLPDWGFSVVCKKNGVAEHAILTCPMSQDEFTASRGSGASLNGKRIRASTLANLEHALVASDIPSTPLTQDNLEQLEAYKEIALSVFQVRSSHCAALDMANVAAGRLDATILQQVNPMELSAALLICKEAGALTGDFSGRPGTENSRQMICANPKLFKIVTQKVNGLRQHLGIA